MGCKALLIWGLYLQFYAPHSNTLQHSATLTFDMRSLAGLFPAGAPISATKKWKKDGCRNACTYVTTHCNTLQYAAIRCNALQHLLLIWGPLQASFRNAPFISTPKKRKRRKMKAGIRADVWFGTGEDAPFLALWPCWFSMCVCACACASQKNALCNHTDDSCQRVTLEWAISHIESCHIWMSHVTYKWVMSHMNESCHIQMSHVTYEWVMSTCYSGMSHFTYEWVMSHVNEACHVWICYVTRMNACDMTHSHMTCRWMSRKSAWCIGLIWRHIANTYWQIGLSSWRVRLFWFEVPCSSILMIERAHMKCHACLFCWCIGLIWWVVGLFWWNIRNVWWQMEEEVWALGLCWYEVLPCNTL